MATVVNQNAPKPPIPVSEQTKIIEYVVDLVKKSDIFARLPVHLNFIDATKDCICVRLGSDNHKTEEYVDGSYEAQITFSVIYRRLHVADVNERLASIDLVNQFGEYTDELVDFNADIPGVDIFSISQKETAGLIYRDDSGIEDNGASFVLLYNKS